jgi:hypothetical protein
LEHNRCGPSLSIALSDPLYDYQGPRIVLGDPSDGIGGKTEVYECTMNNGCSLLDVQLTGYDYEDLFGSGVSTSTNGNVIAIASPGLIECREVCANVKVYAYGRGTEAVWSLVGLELMGAIGFGVNIKLSGDGNILAIVYDIYESSLVSRTQVYAIETGVWRTVGPPIEAPLLDMSHDGTVFATSENGKVAYCLYEVRNANSLVLSLSSRKRQRHSPSTICRTMHPTKYGECAVQSKRLERRIEVSSGCFDTTI